MAPDWDGDRVGKLFAAAPELLEACKLALQRIDPKLPGRKLKPDVPLEPWARESCDALRAAIAKAEGR